MESQCGSSGGEPGPSASLEVLFESRKPLSISRDCILRAVERELAGCVGDACLLPPGMDVSDVASSSKKIMFRLQRWSQKWLTYVDVTCVEDVKDGDKLTVVQAFVSVAGGVSLLTLGAHARGLL